MQDNIDAVDDLALSHEDAPDTHCTIARETGICRSPVTRIIHNDLKSLSAWRKACLSTDGRELVK